VWTLKSSIDREGSDGVSTHLFSTREKAQNYAISQWLDASEGSSLIRLLAEMKEEALKTCAKRCPEFHRWVSKQIYPVKDFIRSGRVGVEPFAYKKSESNVNVLYNCLEKISCEWGDQYTLGFELDQQIIDDDC
jgi:hypothetical protein